MTQQNLFFQLLASFFCITFSFSSPLLAETKSLAVMKQEAREKIKSSLDTEFLASPIYTKMLFRGAKETDQRFSEKQKAFLNEQSKKNRHSPEQFQQLENNLQQARPIRYGLEDKDLSQISSIIQQDPIGSFDQFSKHIQLNSSSPAYWSQSFKEKLGQEQQIQEPTLFDHNDPSLPPALKKEANTNLGIQQISTGPYGLTGSEYTHIRQEQIKLNKRLGIRSYKLNPDYF